MEVTLFAPGVDLISGELVEVKGPHIMVRVRRSRSRKHFVQAINQADVISRSDWEDEDASGETVKMVELQVNVKRLEQTTVEGEIKYNKDGSISVVEENGTVTTFPAGSDLEITGADPKDEEEEKKSSKKAPKKAAKKAKKEEVEDEEDEEAEDEDEEEEKKPSKKAAKKAGKKAKKEVEEEEDDEDWDE